MNYNIKLLPDIGQIETTKVLKKSLSANRALAELKGIISIITDQNILINTLALQEAKDSSAVENIITTHDELFKAYLGLETSIAKITSFSSILQQNPKLRYHRIEMRFVVLTHQ